MSVQFFNPPFGIKNLTDRSVFYVVRRVMKEGQLYEGVRENRRNALNCWQNYDEAAQAARLFRNFYQVSADGIVRMDKAGDISFFELPDAERTDLPMLYADAGSW